MRPFPSQSEVDILVLKGKALAYIQQRQKELSYSGDYGAHPRALVLKRLEEDCIRRYISAELGLTVLEYDPIEKLVRNGYEFWWYDPKQRGFRMCRSIPLTSGVPVDPSEY